MMTDNKKCPNNEKGHFFQVREIEFIKFILCDYCDTPLGRQGNKFLQCVSEENMTRLATGLISSRTFTPAQLTLIDHVKKEVF